MDAIINFFIDLLGADLAQLLAIVSGLIALANVITVFFPSVKENKIYNIIMWVLNKIALNVGKNKNADDKGG